MKTLFRLVLTNIIASIFLRGYCRFPVLLSPVVNRNVSDVCPPQKSIGAGINATKEEIRQAISNIIIPSLDFNMNSQCGGTGWTRAIYLNMSDPNEVCPSSLNLHTTPVRGCGRQTTQTYSCDSVIYPITTGSYSEVCGRILAYQRGSTDAFYNSVSAGYTSIDSAYLDGLSLTHGPISYRQHIWSFAAALYDEDPDFTTRWNCFCTNIRYNWQHQLPSFIGNDYFCDTGNPGPGYDVDAYYRQDPLWDGKGCGTSSTCCQFNNPPWFKKTLPQTTSDAIELRLCQGEPISRDREDVIIFLVEVYVR